MHVVGLGLSMEVVRLESDVSINDLLFERDPEMDSGSIHLIPDSTDLIEHNCSVSGFHYVHKLRGSKEDQSSSTNKVVREFGEAHFLRLLLFCFIAFVKIN